MVPGHSISLNRCALLNIYARGLCVDLRDMCDSLHIPAGKHQSPVNSPEHDVALCLCRYNRNLQWRRKLALGCRRRAALHRLIHEARRRL